MRNVILMEVSKTTIRLPGVLRKEGGKKGRDRRKNGGWVTERDREKEKFESSP